MPASSNTVLVMTSGTQHEVVPCVRKFRPAALERPGGGRVISSFMRNSTLGATLSLFTVAASSLGGCSSPPASPGQQPSSGVNGATGTSGGTSSGTSSGTGSTAGSSAGSTATGSGASGGASAGASSGSTTSGMTSTGDGGCDLTLVLSDPNAACAINETYGVFVSPPASPDAGTAGGTGTRASPLHSIDAAITLAKTGAKRVYACVGYYDEKITVDASRDGVKIYGGLDCTTPTWDFTGDHTGLSPSTPGTTLTLTGLTSAHVEYFELRPLDAPQTPPTTAGAVGASSIAVFIESSTGVTFQNVLATGANAQPGQDQTAAIQAAAEASGRPGSATEAGAQTVNSACMTSIGGAGGAPAAGGAKGSPGEPTGGDAGATGGAAGVKGGVCSAAGTGTGGLGSNGGGGTAGVGASSWGTLDSTGWTPTNGGAGGVGGLGQGGGGGASVTGGGGGAGGAGGCGGAGGLGGTGGGSSIGVLVHNSKVSIAGGSVQAGNGGNGGAGAPGQAGQAGGPGGAGSGTACGGGQGGTGGTGGGGGGGAGGISVGIVWGGATAQVTTDGMVVGTGQVASLNAVQGTGIGGPAGAGGAAAGTGGGAGAAGTPGMAGLGNDNIAALQIP